MIPVAVPERHLPVVICTVVLALVTAPGGAATAQGSGPVSGAEGARRAGLASDTAVIEAVLEGVSRTPLNLTQDYLVRPWSRDTGLDERFRRVIRAGDGYIWRTVPSGLARLDGVGTGMFGVGGDPQLRDGRIPALHDDGRGTLWVGTAEGDLLRYADDEWSVAHRFDSEIRDIATGPRGAVWVALGEGAGRWIDGETKVFPVNRAGGGVEHILVDRSGGVWLGAGDGLRHFINGEFAPFFADEGVPLGGAVADLFEDSGGRLWVLTEGAIMRGGRGGGFERYEDPELPIGGARSITQDADGDIWIVYPDGIRRLPAALEDLPGGGTLSRFVPLPGVVDIAADPGGSLWVVGTGDGLRQIRRSRFLRSGSIWEAEGDAVGVVRSAAPVGDSGALVVDGCRLKHVDLEGAREFPDAVFGDAVDCIRAVAVGRDGTVWVGHDEGMVRLSADGAVTSVSGPGLPEPGTTAEATSVNHILADTTGRIWYAVSGRGIGQLSFPGDESFHDLGASPWGGQVRVMTQHSDGTLWFGTDNGFGRIRDDELEGWPVPEIFSGAAVSDIHVDHDGVLWIGTERGGLVRIEGASRDLAVDLAGLEEEPVRRVLSDGSGSLWVLSAVGLGVVSREQLRERIERPRGENWFPFFNRSLDSAPQPHEDAVAGWRTRDAHMWFVDRDAVIVVDPRTFSFNTVEPPVAIVGVLVDGEELPGSDTFITPIHPTQISVEYRALSFASRVEFRHRLDGRDEGWVEAGTSTRAEYRDLPAGEYTFRVVARNGGGYVWNDEGAAVRIVVPPAWWQRTRVIVGFLLAAAFVSTSAMYGGLRATRRRTAHLERVVEARRTAEAELRLLGRQMVDAQEDDRARIARELHDDINQRLAAASIGAELSARAMETDPAAAASQLRELQERLDAISSDIRKVSHELHPDTLRQLGFVVTFESLLDEFESRTSVSVARSLPEAAEKVPDDVALCLYRVAQEALRNVSEHAEASLVELAVSVSRARATLRIADDGVGFDPEKHPPGLGLASIRERARLLDGSVALDTRPGAGTELVIEIPITGPS